MLQQDIKSTETSEGLRILVAEDSPTMREVARVLLERAGYIVDVAANGAEAVQCAAIGHYALILMDINMPRLNGVEATAMIRALGERTESVPILAMTAEQGQDRIEDILEAGMNGYLNKPFGRAQLLAAIAPWIGIAA